MTTIPRGHVTSSPSLRPCQLAAIACAFCVAFPALAAGLLDREVTVDIPAQPLSQALAQLARQASMPIDVSGVGVAGRYTKGLKGKLRADIALARLLRGSGLSFHVTGNVVTIDTAARAQHSRGPESHTGPQRGQGTASVPATAVKLSDVVVTGTLIPGEQPVGATVSLYTREDMDEAGAATLDQFARQMVENLSDVDPTANNRSNSLYARFSGGAANNVFQGSSFDLHGLGAGATLTLLDGHRLAPAGIDGSFIDTSEIPLAAIDHIEVLADGASAIYGADAVAGVVNIVTRKDYDGASTTVRYGQATEGGAVDLTASQLVGRSWDRGSAFLAYELDRQGGLDASQRDYIGDQGGPQSLIPLNHRNSVFFSGHEQLTDALTVSADALFTARELLNQASVNVPAETSHVSAPGRTQGPTATIDLDWLPFQKWHVNLAGNYSRLKQSENQLQQVTEGSFAETAVEDSVVVTDILGTDLLVSGPVMRLPAGDIKAALGASYRSESFEPSDSVSITGSVALSNSAQGPDGHRNVSSLYGELVIPVVEHENAVPGMQRLEVSAAARLDHYSDFGSTTNPKIGLLWQPVRDISVRGTAGRSFRAPLLDDLDTPIEAAAELLPDKQSPSGSTDTLILNGGNPQLMPEKATSYTGGIDITPAELAGLQLSASYFQVDYQDRISNPPVNGENFLNDPILTPFVVRNPPLSTVEYYFNSPAFGFDATGLGPTGVKALFYDWLANIASTQESGVDLRASYEVDSSYGHFSMSGAAQRLMHYELQATPGGPSVELLNTYGEPTTWKARSDLKWHLAGLGAGMAVHYTNAYDNSLFSPPTRIGSWTTVDLYVSYSTDSLLTASVLHGLTLLFTIQNVADRAPPYAPLPPVDLLPGQNPLPFDPVNASPLGRFVALQITKRWW